MTEVTYIKCDECGETIEKFSGHEGWIEIGASTGTLGVIISGKKYDTGHILHFCSEECLIKWLHRRV